MVNNNVKHIDARMSVSEDKMSVVFCPEGSQRHAQYAYTKPLQIKVHKVRHRNVAVQALLGSPPPPPYKKHEPH
eukprot:9217183-Karenia_brevis.AAC.1